MATTQMGIRLTTEQLAAMKRISEKTGVEVSQLIRFAIDALLKHYQLCGEKLILPIDFDALMVEVDRLEGKIPGAAKPPPKSSKAAA